MEEDGLDILKTYVDNIDNKLSTETTKFNDTLEGQGHPGEFQDGGTTETAAIPLNEVQAPSMQEVFKMMTDMQRQLTALQHGVPMRGSKSNRDAPSTTKQLVSGNASYYEGTSKRGPDYYMPEKHHSRDHDVSSSEIDDEEEEAFKIHADEDSSEFESNQIRAAKTSTANNDKSRKRKGGHQVHDEPPNKKSDDKTTQELAEFAAQYQQEVQKPGDNLEPWLAKVINGMFTAPVKENVNKILKEVKMPANLYLEVPKVNIEVWDNVIYNKKMQDCNMQKLITRQKDVAVLLSQFVNDLFLEREQLPVENTLGREDLKNKAMRICNIISLLGDSAKDSIVHRREILQYAVSDPLIRKEMMKVPYTNEDGIPNTFLFGDNLAEIMKRSDESRRMNAKMSRGKENQSSLRPKQMSKNSVRQGKNSKYKNQQTYADYKKSKAENQNQNNQYKKKDLEYKSPLKPRDKKKDSSRDHH